MVGRFALSAGRVPAPMNRPQSKPPTVLEQIACSLGTSGRCQYRLWGFWQAGHQWDVRPAIVLLRTVSPHRAHGLPALP